MKKIIILLTLFISLLFVTGCGTEYSIEIKENSFSETITINVSNNFSDERIDDLINNTMYPKIDDETNVYNKEIKNKKNSKQIIFSYTYNDTDFEENSLLHQCFDQVNYVKNQDYYLIYITGKFHCLEQNTDVKIKISTDGNVINSNAHKKSGKNYTWTINENNINDVDIKFQVSRPIKEKNKAIKITSALVILGVIGTTIAYVQINKKKKRDNWRY